MNLVGEDIYFDFLFGMDAPARAFLDDRQWQAADCQHQDYGYCVEHSAFGEEVTETVSVGKHSGWK